MVISSLYIMSMVECLDDEVCMDDEWMDCMKRDGWMDDGWMMDGWWMDGWWMDVAETPVRMTGFVRSTPAGEQSCYICFNSHLGLMYLSSHQQLCVWVCVSVCVCVWERKCVCLPVYVPPSREYLGGKLTLWSSAGGESSCVTPGHYFYCSTGAYWFIR